MLKCVNALHPRVFFLKKIFSGKNNETPIKVLKTLIPQSGRIPVRFLECRNPGFYLSGHYGYKSGCIIPIFS